MTDKNKKSEVAKMNDSEADKRNKSDTSSEKKGKNFRINDNMVGEDE